MRRARPARRRRARARRAGAARAETTTITMPGKYFDPPRSTVVAGDLVVFRNSDLVSHDVRIGGGLFDSGVDAALHDLVAAVRPARRLPVRLHAARVHERQPGRRRGDARGRARRRARRRAAVALRPRAGRAPRASASSGRSAAASGWRRAPSATPAPDGTFSATVPAAEGASYRVTTPAGPSPAVTPRVTARVDVHIAVQRARRPHDRRRARDARPARLRRDARALLALALPLARHRA